MGNQGVTVIKSICIAAMTISTIAATGLAAGAAAAPITYKVNQVIGLGSVVGTIQTNGTVGSLAGTDVLGFDLVVSGPGASVELTQADSVVVGQGSNFSATASNLFFDYSGASGYLLFQQGSFGTGLKYYCNSSVLGTCFQGASAIPEAYNSLSAAVEARLGSQIIGSAVPEPASWAMIAMGFALVGAVARRKPVTVTA
jgi:hypothetical protein